MKNRILSLLCCVALVATAGCNKKFLEDMKSYDKYDENLFSNEVQTGWYINRIYNYFYSGYKNPLWTIVGQYDISRSQMTDEIGGTVTNYTNPNKLLQLAAESDGYYGTMTDGVSNNSYTRIRNCNILLEKMETLGQALSESFRNTSKGQMYFFRALQYYDLVRVYGGVPIITTVQTASATDESIRVPRAKSSEVFDQIVKDLDSAAALLPVVWTNTGADYGRFTKIAALAMKSRVLLTAASPLFNANWDNAADEHWQKALDAGLAAETAATAAGYGNAITNSKTWAEVTFANDNAFNGEAIMVNLMSSSTASSGIINNGWESSVRPKDYNGSGGVNATKGMLDLFPLADGTRPVIGVNYNDTFFFENRDPRFYRTFAFSGAKWGHSKNANRTTFFYRWKETAASTSPYYYGNNSTSSPAVVRKMSNPNADTTTLANSGTDIFEYRFGELLLNIAECYAAKGQIAQCVNYLGRLRSRVGIANVNNYGIGTPASKYAALEACLYERRVELAYEGKRFFDLQRWMLYDDDASIGDNTNSKLNIPILNATARTGYYWQTKAYTGSGVKTDPIPAAEKNILIDPDNTATFAAQIQALKDLYNNRFVMTPLDQAMDRDPSTLTPVNILFRSNYYLSGISATVLGQNPWILQTKGWLDYSGIPGTYDYKQ